MSSQSSASKNSGVSYGSANKIICIRPGNYLTNSSAYRAIKRHSRPPDADAISPLSFLFSLLLSRRCLDISWRHATAEPFLHMYVHIHVYVYVLFLARFFLYPFNTRRPTGRSLRSSIGGQFNKNLAPIIRYL